MTKRIAKAYEIAVLDDVARELDSLKPLLWVHAPILLHDRNTDGKACPCCGSKKAVVVETRRDIDLLIDPLRGTRKLRHDVEDKAKFDLLAGTSARKLYMPTRVHKAQLDPVLDDKHKIIGLFGGNRSGKSTAMAERIKRQILLNGGPMAQFWWVAPTREKTRIGVRKLVLGERTDRYVAPLFPRELIKRFPANEKAADQSIRLVDGTEIHLKHASRDGSNLKGDPCLAIFVDEGTAIPHQINWTIMMGRLIDSGGSMTVATTPVGGHWLEEEVVKRGKTYEDAGPEDDIISLCFSCFENPWVDKAEVERTVKAMADPLRIRREIHGQWVGMGNVLWEHFKKDDHLFQGPWRTVEEYGFIDATALAGRSFFKNTDARMDMLGGCDFNVHPMCMIVAQIGVPPGLDPRKPENWILIVQDELIRSVGTIHKFAEYLDREAAVYRKLPEDYFHNMAIACDPTGAQWSYGDFAAGSKNMSATVAKEFSRHGHDVRSCYIGEKGKPRSPPVLDRVSLVHKLMSDRIVTPDGRSSPRLMVHAVRCPELIKSLETQESDAKGAPIKKSHTLSDRLSGPTDALGYLVWALFYRTEYRRPVSSNW